MCRSAIRSVLLFAGLAGSLLPAAIRADDAPESAPLIDLVISRAEASIRIRLTAAANQLPWREHVDRAQSKLSEVLFRQLDGDGNGELSPDEGKNIPNPQTLTIGQQNSDVYVAFNFRVLDENSDGMATADELHHYLAYFAGSPVMVNRVKEQQRPSVGNLFDRLDADGNEKLTRDECRNQTELWKLDADGNGVLTGIEIQPSVPTSGEQEFVAKPIGEKQIPVSLVFEQPGETGPDFICELTLADESGNDEISPNGETGIVTREGFKLTSVSESKPFDVKAAERNPHTLLITIDSHVFEIRMAPSSFRYDVQLQQAVRRQFDSAADPETKSVSRPADLPQPLKNLFPVADRDRDGTVTPDEISLCLDSYLAAHLAAEATRLRISVFPESRDVSAVADRNLDGKISRRETEELVDHLFGPDDVRESIGPGELAGITRIVVQRGPFLTVDAGQMISDLGPSWFYRADRNRDGDLDRGEFLGNAAQFAQIDVDGNGWIDLDEAVAADGQLNVTPANAAEANGNPATDARPSEGSP
ncbi:MAG: hypothetical protein WEB58_23920 [Planctomycetaceae bacterium]